MKKIISIALLFVFTIAFAKAIDVTKKPEPMPATEFKFPDYKMVTLKNGIKVIIVEDHEQPTFNMSLLIPGGSSLDGAKTGVASFTADLLTKGAGTMTAFDIAKKLDGIGADVKAANDLDASYVSASCIKKHLDEVLSVYKDVLLSPTFPVEEFDKLKTQKIAGVKQSKASAGTLGRQLMKMAIYGTDHPYAQRETEASINNIKIEDIKEYYAKNYKPNNAILVIAGDVKEKEIVAKLEKLFAKWEKGDAPQINVPTPKPMPLGVYFVNRPGSKQSTVIVAGSAVAANSSEMPSLKIAQSIIVGGGFGSRLMRTLREQYSFCYTPFGSVSGNKYYNLFNCGADVRPSSTDSSVKVIFDELHNLGNEPLSDTLVTRIKRYLLGNYKMAFESSDFVAGLIQRAEFQGKSMDEVKNYDTKIEKMSIEQIQAAAYKFFNPKTAYIIVVGSKDVRASLEKYGKIYDYNVDLEPQSGAGAKMDKTSLTGEDIIKKYVKAIGGEDKINAVKTLKTVSTIELTVSGMPPMNGTSTEIKVAPNKQNMSLDLGVMKQQFYCNGEKVWTVQTGQTIELTPDQAATYLVQAEMFNEAKLLKDGYKLEVLGKKDGFIVVKAAKGSEESTFYYNADTYLLEKKESIEEGQSGPMTVTTTLSDYQEINGIKFPCAAFVDLGTYQMKSTLKYEINPSVEGIKFEPAK